MVIRAVEQVNKYRELVEMGLKFKRISLPVLVGGAAIAAVSCIVIPPVMKKVSSKLYKAQAGTDDVDFDDMGPEIVPIKKDPVDVAPESGVSDVLDEDTPEAQTVSTPEEDAE